MDMMQSNVADIAPASAEGVADMPAFDMVSTPPGGVLGKDEFLKLLVTQLSFQDPFDPMDSRESIAQLAQFSALEQMQNLNEQVESMRQAGGLVDGLLLQGAAVSVELGNGMRLEGIIDSVYWQNGDMKMRVDGREVAMSDVVEMRLLEPEPVAEDDVVLDEEETE